MDASCLSLHAFIHHIDRDDVLRLKFDDDLSCGEMFSIFFDIIVLQNGLDFFILFNALDARKEVFMLFGIYYASDRITRDCRRIGIPKGIDQVAILDLKKWCLASTAYGADERNAWLGILI